MTYLDAEDTGLTVVFYGRAPLTLSYIRSRMRSARDRRTQIRHGAVDRMYFITCILSLILKSRPDS